MEEKMDPMQIYLIK